MNLQQRKKIKDKTKRMHLRFRKMKPVRVSECIFADDVRHWKTKYKYLERRIGLNIINERYQNEYPESLN